MLKQFCIESSSSGDYIGSIWGHKVVHNKTDSTGWYAIYNNYSTKPFAIINEPFFVRDGFDEDSNEIEIVTL